MKRRLHYPKWLLEQKLDYWRECLKCAEKEIKRKKFKGSTYPNGALLVDVFPNKVERERYKEKEYKQSIKGTWLSIKDYTTRITDLEEALIILEDM